MFDDFLHSRRRTVYEVTRMQASILKNLGWIPGRVKRFSFPKTCFLFNEYRRNFIL